jgi:hypothetical protein
MNKGGVVATLESRRSFTAEYFYWWYGEALKRMLVYFRAFLLLAFDFFSVRILLKTFFAPWKRDIASAAGMALEGKMKIFVLNLISRFIGMAVKSLTLFAFIIFFAFLLVVEVLVFLSWFFFPLLSLLGLIYGLSLILGWAEFVFLIY